MRHRGRRQRHPGLQAPSHQLALGFGVVHAAAIALAAADQVGNQIDGVLCHGVHLLSWWTPSSALNRWSERWPWDDAYELDEKGFVITGHGAELATSPFATSQPGVFAVGDVRAGSVKRVASSVGEGSVVISKVWEFVNS